jgi:hypothetical protein
LISSQPAWLLPVRSVEIVSSVKVPECSYQPPHIQRGPRVASRAYQATSTTLHPAG